MNDKGKWYEYFEHDKIVWLHNGDSNMPHVVLRSGLHSGGYFNSSSVTGTPWILMSVVNDLLVRLKNAGLRLSDLHYVIGPAMGAITLAYELARQCSTQFHRVGTAYAEKCSRGGEPAMRFPRHCIPESAGVLVAEDTITTGGSVLHVFEALRKMGIEPMPMVVTILNRSGKQALSERGPSIISLIDEYMPTWTPAECPLCKAGSLALKEPKTTRDWDRLIGK